MTEELAFLTHLASNPGDDVTRLVYADWLDERGDERAGFLRAEQELAGLCEDDPRAARLGRELSERRRSIRWDWLGVAGKRWDAWLTAFPPPRKIQVIKAVRELTGCGLAEGKWTVEAAPMCVLRSCTRAEAEMACEHLRRAGTRAETVGLAIRPCPAPGREVMFTPGHECELVIRGYRRPDARNEVLAALRSLLYRVVPDDSRLPWTFDWLSKPTAQRLAQELQTLAVVEVVPKAAPEERAVRVPIFASLTGPGPFEVRLLSYPPEKQREVIAAVHDLTGTQWTDIVGIVERPPVLLRQGVDGAEAERVRRLFAELGEVEIIGPATR
jgi:uncharacterized protein (TIGR02996 family)